MAQLDKAIEIGKMYEWSTSVKLGIQPNPPLLKAMYNIWASERRELIIFLNRKDV
jgi:hypothetical protein